MGRGGGGGGGGVVVVAGICSRVVAISTMQMHTGTTKPWGSGIAKFADEPAPTQEMSDSQCLYNEPKFVRFDDGDVHTLESNGLKMKKGVYY